MPKTKPTIDVRFLLDIVGTWTVEVSGSETYYIKDTLTNRGYTWWPDTKLWSHKVQWEQAFSEKKSIEKLATVSWTFEQEVSKDGRGEIQPIHGSNLAELLKQLRKDSMRRPR